MNKGSKLCVMTVLVLLFLAVSIASYSIAGDDKKGKITVASLDVSGPSNISEAKSTIPRGEIVTINALLKSDGATKSDPFQVRIYLSSRSDGSDAIYEFDIFHEVSLDKPSNNGRMGNNQDMFHGISQDKSGVITVTGRYAFPFSIGAGYSYWVVVEAGPDGRTVESPDNKSKAISVISVPCDQFEAYHDGDTYHCPFKPGKED